MCDTNLEWTVFLDSFCLLQNYWTWKWCNDDNEMSFLSTNHIYLSLFYWNVFIFVLTLFLRVDWIVTLLDAMYGRDGRSSPFTVDHLLPPFFSFHSVLWLSISPSLYFPFPFHSLFRLIPANCFLSHLILLHHYSFSFPSLFLSFSTSFILFHFLSDFCLQFIIKLCSDNINKKLNVGISQKA